MLYRGIELPGRPCPENVRKLDILPLGQIRRMQRMGVCIDRQWLWDLSSRLDTRKQELRKDIASYIPPDRLDEFVGATDDDIAINVDSAEQIAKLLFDLLGVGWGKKLKKTKGGDRLSTGKKQLETLKRDHKVIPLILEYRECSKLKSTYTDKLPLIARLHTRGDCLLCGRRHRKDHYRVHTSILTTRTDTGRLASKNPNLQNIPARTKLGAEVRKAFTPECEDYTLLSCDYSQIELRLVAHAAQEPNMVRIFQSGGDIHLDTAMRAFGISDPKAVDKMLHRAPCKNVNFGVCIAYGQRVLTDHGLIAIQDIRCHHRVWDGTEFVTHDGLIFRGFRSVLTYDGLTATPDHEVWVQDDRKIPLAQAVAEGSRLVVTGCEGVPIRLAPSGFQQDTSKPERLPDGVGSLHGVRSPQSPDGGQHTQRQNDKLQVQCSNKVDRSACEDVGGTLRSNQTAMYEPELRVVRGLWGTRHSGQIRECGSAGSVYHGHVPTPQLQGSGYRSDRQQWPLRAGKYPNGTKEPQSAQYSPKSMGGIQRSDGDPDGSVRTASEGLPRFQSVSGAHTSSRSDGSALGGNIEESSSSTSQILVPVFDILNAGPRRRFTVEGKLVSNCYGLGAPGLYDLMAVTYATAGKDVPDWLTVEWCDGFIQKWFNLYPQCHEYFELQHYRARRYEIVWDFFGRVRRVPEVRSVHERVQAAGLRQAGNMPIQASAAGVFKLGAAKTEERFELLRSQGIEVEALLPIHDELLIEVERGWEDEVKEWTVCAMNSALEDVESGESHCRVPVKVDGKIMTNQRWEKE